MATASPIDAPRATATPLRSPCRRRLNRQRRLGSRQGKARAGRSRSSSALFEGLFQRFEKRRVSFRDRTQSGKADHPVSVDEE